MPSLIHNRSTSAIMNMKQKDGAKHFKGQSQGIYVDDPNVI
jgi:hypothetical protein